jgi:hypothetical protein
MEEATDEPVLNKNHLLAVNIEREIVYVNFNQKSVILMFWGVAQGELLYNCLIIG